MLAKLHNYISESEVLNRASCRQEQGDADDDGGTGSMR